MTREIYDRMPQHVKDKLDNFRRDYKNALCRPDVARVASSSYLLGLRDAGLISERERQVLFVYTTI